MKEYQIIKNEDGTFGAIVTDVDVEDTITFTPSPIEEIESCKEQLSATDYKAIKYAEGLISEDDYAPIKAERQALRDRINELEKEL